LSTFTRLSGTISVKHGSNIIITTADLTQEIARNDVIVIEGKAYRISSASVRVVEKAGATAGVGEDGQVLLLATDSMDGGKKGKRGRRKGSHNGTPEERAAMAALREKQRAERQERRKDKGRVRARLRWQVKRQQLLAERATSIAQQLAARGELVDDGTGAVIQQYASKLLAEANATGGRIKLDGTIVPGKGGGGEENAPSSSSSSSASSSIGPDGQPIKRKRGRPAGSKTKSKVSAVGPDGLPLAVAAEPLDSDYDDDDDDGGLDSAFEQASSSSGKAEGPARKKARLDESGNAGVTAEAEPAGTGPRRSGRSRNPSSSAATADAATKEPKGKIASKAEDNKKETSALMLSDDEDDEGPNDDDISIHSSDASSSSFDSDDDDSSVEADGDEGSEGDHDGDGDGGAAGEDIDFDPEAIRRKHERMQRKRAKAAMVMAGFNVTGAAEDSSGAGGGSGKSVRFADSAASSSSSSSSSSADAAAQPHQHSSSSRSLSVSQQIQLGIGTLYPETGIYTVSVANDVKRTGGAFSVADTAPHRLPSTSGGYVFPFTATQIPLDRPYEGQDKTGIVAYKWGASLDVRTLWRLMAAQTASDVSAATGVTVNPALEAAASAAGQPGAQVSLADSLTAAAGAGAADGAGGANAAAGSDGAGGAVTSAGRAIGIIGSEGILPRLGGMTALRHLRPFPSSHLELRGEMKKAGLGETLLEPGTNLTEGVIVKSLQERREEQRRSRIRKPHKANLQLNLGSLDNTAVGAAAKSAMIEIAIERYLKDQQAAALARAEAAAGGAGKK
jgi:hypothetical protein